MESKNYYNLYSYGVARNIIYKTKEKIEQFNDIVNNKLLMEEFRGIDIVYMNSVILDIAKLISATNSDKAGLKQFKNIAPKKYKNELEKLEKKYKNIFLKITENRNRIIVHIDISNYNMGPSKDEINRFIDNHKKSPDCTDKNNKNDPFILGMKKIKAKSKKNERYSLSDFQKDIPKIKLFLNEFLEIIDGINIYYCQKN